MTAQDYLKQIQREIGQADRNINDINEAFNRSEQRGSVCFQRARMINDALRIKADLIKVSADIEIHFDQQINVARME